MGEPILTSCCFCLDLKSAAKIIGCFRMLLAAFFMMLSIMLIEPAALIVTPELHREVAMEASVLLVVCAMIAFGQGAVLLMGVYQNRVELVKVWVIAAITTLLVVFGGFIEVQGHPVFVHKRNFMYFTYFIIDLYSITVVHSLSQQMQKMTPTINAFIVTMT